MNVIVLDDERIILQSEAALIKSVMSDASVTSFRSFRELLAFAETNRIDVAFLDISLGEISGIEVAKRLQEYNPRINIIFCTGYSEYALDSMKLYASGYLLKPLTKEAIIESVSKLRYEVAGAGGKLTVRCFGNFEVLFDGDVVRFKYSRTKELFAYLIDRRGALVSSNEIMAALFEDDNKGSHIRNLKADLISTFNELKIDHLLIQQKGKIGLHIDLIDCDYFKYLNGSDYLFNGEYMSQYSFAERTLAYLMGN